MGGFSKSKEESHNYNNVTQTQKRETMCMCMGIFVNLHEMFFAFGLCTCIREFAVKKRIEVDSCAHTLCMLADVYFYVYINVLVGVSRYLRVCTSVCVYSCVSEREIEV